MLYIACAISNEMATVISVHREGHLARARIDREAGKRAHVGDLHALPVSMARAGSMRPKVGDVLATMSEASGLVAVARVTA